MTAAHASLAELCRGLGDPAREWAILAEGNASLREGESLLVTASGSSLLDPRFVAVDAAAVLAAIDEAGDDAEWAQRISAASAGGGRSGRATVEVGLHAVATSCADVRYVGHTHPTAITGLLCSERAEELVSGMAFPDQVVVCGAKPLFLPYVDPGLSLARAFRQMLQRHCEAHGAPPKAVYMANHGLVALGASAQEVLQITSMADKAARVMATAATFGGVRLLPAAEVARIDGRADEAYRRSILAAAELRP